MGQVQDYMEPSIRILHPSRWTKQTGVRHDMVRDACDAGKIRVVHVRTENQHADVFITPLDTQKFHKHSKTVFKVG